MVSFLKSSGTAWLILIIKGGVPHGVFAFQVFPFYFFLLSRGVLSVPLLSYLRHFAVSKIRLFLFYLQKIQKERNKNKKIQNVQKKSSQTVALPGFFFFQSHHHQGDQATACCYVHLTKSFFFLFLFFAKKNISF